MKWYINALKNYNNYHGRASRREAFWANAINTVIIVILYLVESTAGWFESSYFIYVLHLKGYGIIELIYTFAVLVPIICVNIRRLHDIDKSGYYYMLNGIPIVCVYLWYMIFCKKGTSGKNKYGYPPGTDDIEGKEKQDTAQEYRYTIINSPVKTMYGNNPEEYEGISQYKKVNNEAKDEISTDDEAKIKNTEALVVKEKYKTMMDAEVEDIFKESDVSNNIVEYTVSIKKPTVEVSQEKEEQLKKYIPKYCRKCGKHLVEDSNFCRFCGTKVEI